MKISTTISASIVAFICSASHSHAAALALTEGASEVSEAYGTDVYVNFPAVYTSGQYTLSWYQNVQSTFDTIHPIYVSQGLMTGDFRTGSNPSVDGIAGSVGGVPITRNAWQQHVFLIDLDSNTYGHTFDGGDVVAAGTVWDGQVDANSPSLGSINIWVGLEGAGANLDGIDGSVFVDDFLLTDGSGAVLWSEDFENGLGSFVDFGGNVTPVIDSTMQVPEPTTCVFGALGLLCLTARRSRK